MLFTSAWTYHVVLHKERNTNYGNGACNSIFINVVFATEICCMASRNVNCTREIETRVPCDAI